MLLKNNRIREKLSKLGITETVYQSIDFLAIFAHWAHIGGESLIVWEILIGEQRVYRDIVKLFDSREYRANSCKLAVVVLQTINSTSDTLTC